MALLVYKIPPLRSIWKTYLADCTITGNNTLRGICQLCSCCCRDLLAVIAGGDSNLEGLSAGCCHIVYDYGGSGELASKYDR